MRIFLGPGRLGLLRLLEDDGDARPTGIEALVCSRALLLEHIGTSGLLHQGINLRVKAECGVSADSLLAILLLHHDLSIIALI